MVDYTYLNEATREELVELMDGDADEIIDLIDTLLDSTPEYEASLRTAIQEQNAPEARDAAHAMKSAYAQIGAMHMSELMKHIEAAAKAGDMTTVGSLASQIEPEKGNVDQALASWTDHLRKA